MCGDVRGIRQFLLGSGSARLTPIILRNAHNEVAYNASHGVLKVTLKDNGCE